uniref:Uncharacterized protein n=1 Tax=Pavo cristatus TaxID=9049 RepID=A0A8C9FHJ9_PAVCR
MNYWLIIRLPILIAIGVNFLIFIRVICIIISKLQANLMCKTDIKCSLIKLLCHQGCQRPPFVSIFHSCFSLTMEHAGMELSPLQLCLAKQNCSAHSSSVFYSSMKPLKCPANSISSGGTVGSSVYAATCQATFS